MKKDKITPGIGDYVRSRISDLQNSINQANCDTVLLINDLSQKIEAIKDYLDIELKKNDPQPRKKYTAHKREHHAM